MLVFSGIESLQFQFAMNYVLVWSWNNIQKGQCKLLIDEVWIFYNTKKNSTGTHPVHSEQMDDIIKWTERFRHEAYSTDEVVVFDIVGGDFNTDNMSPGE